MSAQRIRRSLADLASEYDQPAFPELEPGTAPAARVSRTRPPTVAEAAATLPPPIPVVVPEETSPTPSTSTAPPPKPKSRFALQREKEAAEKAQRNERFELNLDDVEAALKDPGTGAPSDRKVQAAVVKGIQERTLSKKAVPPAPPSAPRPLKPSAFATRPTGFPASARGVFAGKQVASNQASVRVPKATTASQIQEREDDEQASVDDRRGDADSLLRDVSRENEAILGSMSEAEILEEQRQVREELGLSEGLICMLQARAAKRSQSKTETPRPTPTPRSRPAAAASASAPVPQPALADEGEEVEEEGTPEYIRRHFFPNEPPNPALDWMKPPLETPASEGSGPLVSFDLKGNVVAGDAGNSVPAAFAGGDHHVSSSTTFTIPSLLALTSSAIPSQRSTAFQVLARIVGRHNGAQLRLERKELATLRADCVTCACHGLRESNLSILIAALELLLAVLCAEIRSTDDNDAVSTAMPTSVGVLIEMNPFPRFAEQLSSARIPRKSISDVLQILSTLVTMSISREGAEVLDLITATPGLVESVNRRFLATAWPPQQEEGVQAAELPDFAAFAFLNDLARSSRSHAKVVAGASLVESHLRFVAVPSWELPQEHRVWAQGLETATFSLWSTLGRYGLATTLRTQAGELLSNYSQRLSDLRRDAPVLDSAATGELRCLTAYLTLLGVWTTAAIDPHVTGHDITWSQVESWRDVGLDAHELAFAALERGGSDQGDALTLLVAAWDLLGSWLEGSKTNKSWRGEHERRWVVETLASTFAEEGQAYRILERVCGQLIAGEDALAARVIATALRLSEATYETSDPPTPHLLNVRPAKLSEVIEAIVSRASPDQASTAVLEFALRRLEPAARIPLAVSALPLFSAADAVVARDLVEQVISFVAKGDASALPYFDAFDARERQALAEVGFLRPFVTHAIVLASAGKVVGPLFPTPRDIKLTACLPPFGSKGPVLRSGWPMSVLDELLRSADSQVFRRLPADWNVSEVQLVRSALILFRFILDVGKVKIDATTVVYDLIKVFMLEKDNTGTTTGSSGAEREVFRDDVVQRSLSSLLGRLSIGAAGVQRLKPDERPSARTLEGVSARISSAPFFQLYQDLVGLYDSISLSELNFGLVLWPPLAMAYPVDYRRLLWTDFAHLLPHLSFTVEEAISDVDARDGALAAYLQPRETSAPVLSAYVEALIGQRVSPTKTPLLHLVAVHHVSRALFTPGLEPADRQLAERLVRTLVSRGAGDALRTILGYAQAEQEGASLVLPPLCFEATIDSDRISAVEAMGGLGVAELLQAQ